MTDGDTNHGGGNRRWSGWDDIVQFEWNDLLEDTPIDDLLVIDDQTREVLDYLGHAPLEDIMRFEWNDFLDGRKADTDEEVERPVRWRRR
ncbi:MAG TPA: hypothetical protein P5131_07060 [Methanoculleus sp.]|nr:hypothetical protein [Methanoculleus sp.]